MYFQSLHPIVDSIEILFQKVSDGADDARGLLSRSLCDALLLRPAFPMPWAQRVTNTVLRSKVICIPAAVRQPVQYRLPAIRSPAYAPPLLRDHNRCIASMARRTFGRALPLQQAVVGEPGVTVVSPDSMEQLTLHHVTSSDSSGDSIPDIRDAAYRVVNFYHLVDIQNPYKAGSAAALHAISNL